jgi:hypothetical protein
MIYSKSNAPGVSENASKESEHICAREEKGAEVPESGRNADGYFQHAPKDPLALFEK